MQTADLIKQVRALEFATRKNVSELFAGNYKSSFKGAGIEFFEVREYMEGDDVRDIEWNVTAREGRAFIKKYAETRELTTMLLVDGSASLLTGSRGMIKRELLLRFSATIAFSALKNNDKIGLTIFSDKIERHVPARKGRKHVLRVLRDIAEYDFVGKRTDHGKTLAHFGRMTKKSAICFFMSDFLEPFDSWSHALKAVNARHDLILIALRDKSDAALPPVGLAAFENPETGERIVVDTASKKGREIYRSLQEKLFEDQKRLLQKYRVDALTLFCDHDVYRPLFLFFKRRRLAFR